MRNALQTSPNPPIIQVENLSKQFSANIQQQVSLRHEASSLIRAWVKRSSPDIEAQAGLFYALKEVSFSIQQGESVAIVGRNGAGKTTLLRLLAGIMRPTTGSVMVNGRFTALIGLGTGFNPVMTGRQNIFLTAAIYGLQKHEIETILPQIIAFADIGAFIDAPIKQYSSGMVARLGFSVAAHILPDIIFLDEILAVGDAAFQEKCTELLYALKAEGRTFIMVSHALAAMQKMCERTLWLERGQLQADGPSEEILARFLDSLGVGKTTKWE